MLSPIGIVSLLSKVIFLNRSRTIFSTLTFNWDIYLLCWGTGTLVQNPWFDFELWLLSKVQSFYGFNLIAYKYAYRWTGYAKLSVGVNEHVNVYTWMCPFCGDLIPSVPRTGCGWTASLIKTKQFLKINDAGGCGRWYSWQLLKCIIHSTEKRLFRHNLLAYMTILALIQWPDDN